MNIEEIKAELKKYRDILDAHWDKGEKVFIEYIGNFEVLGVTYERHNIFWNGYCQKTEHNELFYVKNCELIIESPTQDLIKEKLAFIKMFEEYGKFTVVSKITGVHFVVNRYDNKGVYAVLDGHIDKFLNWEYIRLIE